MTPRKLAGGSSALKASSATGSPRTEAPGRPAPAASTPNPALPPLCLARLPVGASDADLPRAQGPRRHDPALRRALAHGPSRLDLRRWRPASSPTRSTAASASMKSIRKAKPAYSAARHRPGPVGQADGHHRQRRIVRNHPHVQQRLRRRRARRRATTTRRTAAPRSTPQRGASTPRQQRRLPGRLRHDAGGL